MDISYYDFRSSHPDFDDTADIQIRQPRYINSPYGAWLAVSDSPQMDTFSDWFRNVSVTNHNFQTVLVLEEVNKSHYRLIILTSI